MGSPLRVAFTVEQCWHRVPGGTATAALDLAVALQRRDDVELVGVAAAHRAPPPEPFRPPMPVRHHRLPRRVLYEAWHRLNRPAVTAATGPVDLVHGTGAATPPRRGRPLVVTVHDLAVVHHPDHFTANGRLFLRAALATARRRADVVVCPSQVTVDDCAAHGFDPARLVCVPHGVHIPAVEGHEVDELRRQYGRDGRFVLFVGTREPRKNLIGLARAMVRLPDPPPLVLVGPSGWGDETPLPAQLDVRVVGFVPRARLDALYAAATVFCYPALLEGFGLPVLEAMAAGTAVVTSAGTATEELVGDGGLTVDPTDTDALAAALETVLTDADPHLRWGVAGRTRARRYDWDTAAAGTIAAYRRALDP